MPIPCYLAMTGAEFLHADRFPDKLAWMACHYSCYGSGLSNLPEGLPAGSLIIVNDRTPPCRHDTAFITEQLLQLYEDAKPFGFLLDFQREGLPKNLEVARAVTDALACPVAVSELYAKELDAPVFLPLLPTDMPLTDFTAPWNGREIWLEVGLQTDVFTVTAQGCTVTSSEDDTLAEPVFEDQKLFCRYHWELFEETAVFTLQRTKTELDALLQNAEGVELAVGLYQQLETFQAQDANP